jgi:hypothetical protein
MIWAALTETIESPPARLDAMGKALISGAASDAEAVAKMGHRQLN